MSKLRTPEEFWNGMSPAERLTFILEAEKLSGEKIGHSNSKNRYGLVANKTLRSLIEENTKRFNADSILSSKESDVKPSIELKKSRLTPMFESVKVAASSLYGTASVSKFTFTLESAIAIFNNELEKKSGCEIEEFTDASKLHDDLGLDSLDVVELVMDLERSFDIAIPDDGAVENFASTVGRAKEYVFGLIDLKYTSGTSTDVAPEVPVAPESLDLCISFDDTGSMYSVRQQVRSKVNELVSQLFKDIKGLRVGIIIHNDYCDMPKHIFTLDFTTDFTKIKNFVNQSSPCGGGDAPECYELALHEASKFDWKSDRRALIMIGDEIPHIVGYRYGIHTNNIDWRKETQVLESLNVQVYGVQALGRHGSTHFYESISKMTGGIKLDLSQFQHISTYINAIAYHQSGQLDTYQSSDPSFNTNLALKNMFNKLKGGTGSISTEKIELLSKFQVMKVDTDGETSIRDFVESKGCTFRKGRGFYQLVERTADGKANSEIVQADKEVLFIDKSTGETISDTNWCREKLGVPYGIKATVRPLSIPDVMKKYEIYIQSNSYNRKLDKGVNFLYELSHV